ncbi:MAG: phosphatidylserine decarboxylase family protein [Desulfotignum sp.]|nr:phosphatidylserine decarboxylase family protein [Desulfotignum sp.]
MDRTKWPGRAVLPVAVPGIKYIVGAACVTGVFFYLGWSVAGIVAAVLTLFTGFFFRDPDRQPPVGDDLLVSPADGRVILVDRGVYTEYLPEECRKVSIFMNVFNVHVNRFPLDGVVKKVVYTPGRFINASFDKASEFNERNALTVRTSGGIHFVVVQIAGLIARRIVNCAKTGSRLHRGERYGMIQFGSRLDLYLPVDCRIRVETGDKTRAGETVIAQMPSLTASPM